MEHGDDILEYEVPDDVIAEWGKACDCCPHCHQERPCAGVMAGGLCDNFCQCEPDDYQQDYSLPWDDTED